MTIQILGGSTSQTVRLFIQDTSKTDGSGLTGLVHNTSGLVAYYSKGATGTSTAITLATQTAGGAWTSGGFVAVDGTNMPGVYRLDLPNAALDSEVETIVMLRGAANMAPVLLRVMGGKSQANAVTVADKTGYSLTVDTGLGNQTANITGSLSGSVGSVTGAVGSVTAAVTVGTNNDKTGYTLAVTPPTAATIADAVLDELISEHLTPGSLSWAINQIRKANPTIEGTVLASPTPTTTVFSVSGINYPTGAFLHAVLLFADDASIAEQNSPILTYVNNGDGTSTITTEHPFTAAPATGDKILIIPTTHVHSVAAIQAGLATLANQTIIAGYLDTEITAIKSVTDKLNTGLVQDGGVYQFTANMLELAPAGGGGGGGSGDATEANQELILDQLDLIQAKTDLIGNAAALVAVASLQPGTISSFPETLRAGDSYTTENGRAITVQLLDTNGDPIEQSGSLLFTDAVVEFKIRRSSETDSSRIIVGTAEVTNPAGTGENQGPYVTIELASEETAKGIVKYRYTGLLTFTWPGTSDEVVSFETGQVTFND